MVLFYIVMGYGTLWLMYRMWRTAWHMFFQPMFDARKGKNRPVSQRPSRFRFRKPLSRMTGLEYESEAARWLKQNGYHQVKVTPASNDYGADITARDRVGRLWVFQCKLYSSTLGNKPVQEVVAAKAHYGASCAAVITNSTLSKAAQQLARENNVKIICLK